MRKVVAATHLLCSASHISGASVPWFRTLVPIGPSSIHPSTVLGFAGVARSAPFSGVSPWEYWMLHRFWDGGPWSRVFQDLLLELPLHPYHSFVFPPPGIVCLLHLFGRFLSRHLPGPVGADFSLKRGGRNCWPLWTRRRCRYWWCTSPSRSPTLVRFSGVLVILGTVFLILGLKKKDLVDTTGRVYSGLGLHVVDTVPAGTGVTYRYFYSLTLTK